MMTMENVKVSVIVPVYNAEKCLRRCVDTILQQTLKDIEVILVDDGSTDGSPRLADELQDSDRRIRVIHTKNGGPARARNLGMDIAKGEYVGFVDADDYIEPNMYERMYTYAQRTDAQIVMCGFDRVQKGVVLNQMPIENKDILVGARQIEEQIIGKYYSANVGTYASLCNKIYDAACLRRLNMRIDETLVRAEDYWFNFELYQHVDCIASVDIIGYHYTQDNDNSIMHGWRPEFFSQTTQSRRRLLEEKPQTIVIDPCEFASSYLYEVAVYMKDMVKQHNYRAINEVMSEKFYLEQAKYSEKLPRHIQLITESARKNRRYMTLLLLKLWGLTSK